LNLEGALPAKYTFTIKNDFMLIMWDNFLKWTIELLGVKKQFSLGYTPWTKQLYT
jgi:hypothetical protein